MSCHVMLCRVRSCHVLSLTRVVSRWVRLLASRVGSCHVALCHARWCHVVSCHVMSCHVLSLVVDKSRVPMGSSSRVAYGDMT